MKQCKTIGLVSAVFLLAFSVVPVQSTCLDESEKFIINYIEQELNLSNQSLFALFEARCAESVRPEEVTLLINTTNQRIDNLYENMGVIANASEMSEEEIRDEVHKNMQNYTDWFEEEIAVYLLLQAIYNNTNKTVDTSDLAELNYVNDEFSEMNRDYDDLAERVDALEGNMTNVMAVKTGTTGYTTANYGFEWWVYLIIIIAAVAIAQHMGWINLKKMAKPELEAEETPRRSSEEGPMDQGELEDTDDLRKKQAKELFENQRLRIFNASLQKAESPEQAKKLMDEYEGKDAGDKVQRKPAGKAGKEEG